MNSFTVYQHITPNNKIYIGITSQPVKRRWKNGNGYRGNIHFFNAIKKYGWNNIQHIILYEGLTEDEAKEKEIMLISQYNSTNRNLGYNISSGGDLGLPLELRKKYSHKYTEDEKVLKMEESPVKKKVYQVDRFGSLIGSYCSIREAAFQITGDRRNGKWITQVCQGNKNNYKGYIWLYEEDFSEENIKQKLADFKDCKRENLSNKKVEVIQKDLWRKCNKCPPILY